MQAPLYEVALEAFHYLDLRKLDRNSGEFKKLVKKLAEADRYTLQQVLDEMQRIDTDCREHQQASLENAARKGLM